MFNKIVESFLDLLYPLRNFFLFLFVIALPTLGLITACSQKPDKYQTETISRSQQYMNAYNAEITKTPVLSGCAMSIITPPNYKSVYIVRCPASSASMTMMNSTVQNTITIDGTTYIKQN